MGPIAPEIVMSPTFSEEKHATARTATRIAGPPMRREVRPSGLRLFVRRGPIRLWKKEALIGLSFLQLMCHLPRVLRFFGWTFHNRFSLPCEQQTSLPDPLYL